MIEKELTPEDSKMIQALSVMAMLCLHLFDTWNYADKFTPLLFVGGVPLSFYVGQLSDFCVFGFAFCSGYGHMVQFGREHYYKRRLKGLLSVLISFWTVMAVFSVVCILAGQGAYMPGSVSKVLKNALLIESSYNGAWWYMFAYAVLILMSPLLLKAVEKCHPVIILGLSFAVYCAAYYVRFKVTTDNWLLIKFGPFGMTLFEYIVGVVCYKIKFFSRTYGIWKRVQKPIRWVLSMIVIIALLYVRTKVVPSLFVAPVSGFILMTLFHFWEKPNAVKNAFLFIGGHSTNIWLTHMFFYLYIFEGFVFIAKYPSVIFLLMLVTTVSISIVLQPVQKSIQKLLSFNMQM